MSCTKLSTALTQVKNSDKFDFLMITKVSSTYMPVPRTVARKSFIGGIYACAGWLYVHAGGLDIQI